MYLSVNEIERAAKRLRGVTHHTGLEQSSTFSKMCGGDIYLKYENQQKTGSFKIRGAFNKLSALCVNERPTEVIAASAGNHAQGVAYAASSLGIKSIIVMPKGASIAKVSAAENYGAEVVLYGDAYDDAYKKALEIRDESGGAFIHAFDDIDIIAGQGTIGLEILKDLSTVDMIAVPAGGGGLLSGISFCIKNINPRVKIIGVQAKGADAIYQSFIKKEPVVSEYVKTIADGIAVKEPGHITQNIINQYVDEIVTVSDEEISAAILLLLERDKNIVEPAGAVGLAAALNNKFDVANKKIVCVLSGGNIDVGFIHRIIEKGLVSRGRLIKFRTILLDIPGSLEHFARVISSAGANIVTVQHDRLNANLALNESILHIACEVSGGNHSKIVMDALEKAGYHVLME